MSEEPNREIIEESLVPTVVDTASRINAHKWSDIISSLGTLITMLQAAQASIEHIFPKHWWIGPLITGIGQAYAAYLRNREQRARVLVEAKADAPKP